MNRMFARCAVAVAAAAGLMQGAQTPAPLAAPAPQTAPAPAADGDVQTFLSAMNALTNTLAGVPVAGVPAAAQQAPASLELKAAPTAAEPAPPAAAAKQRPLKNTMILITSGAAAGAAIGAAAGKGAKGAMIGAAAGGAAGLIYDRLTYKNPGKL